MMQFSNCLAKLRGHVGVRGHETNLILIRVKLVVVTPTEASLE